MRAALALLCLVSTSVAAPSEQAKPVDSSELIRDLGDDRYPVRVRASHELWSRGESALPLLEKAIQSPDPEVAARARDVHRKIRIGILPESPPEVVALVEQYDSANPAKRREIIASLKKLRAWRQVLRLYQLEQDPATLSAIAEEMEGVAVSAARELLASETPDYPGAREMLELGRKDPGQIMALADFLRFRGELDTTLRQLREPRSEASRLRRAFFLAAAGRPLDAAREAELGKYTETAARLHLLAGDPVPWLSHAKIPDREIPPAALEAYRQAAVGLWKNQPVPAAFTKDLVQSITTADDDESWHSLGILYALGLHAEADRALARIDPVSAFSLFDSLEDIDEALRVLGLDPAKPDFAAWTAKRFEVLIDEPGDRGNEMSELAILGSFLERRGEIRLLDDLFTPPLITIGKDDPEAFIEIIGEFFGGANYETSRITSPVIKAAASFAGDDEVRLAAVLAAILGEGEHVNQVWETLDAYMPGADLASRLRTAAAILGTVPDTQGDFPKWWDLTLASTTEGQPFERTERLGLLAAVAMLNPDARRFLDVLERAEAAGFKITELGGFSEDFGFSEWRPECMLALGQWKELAALYEAALPNNPWDVELLIRCAATLRRAGQEKLAAEREKTAERLVLGDTGIMRRIGQIYSSFGDFKRAADWWNRGALASVAADGEFLYCGMLLGLEAKNQGDWKLASSLGEMTLLFQVMRGDFRDEQLPILRSRREIHVARALALLRTDRSTALELLDSAGPGSAIDGSMADFFFEPLRRAGLTDRHDRYFEIVWDRQNRVVQRYPGSYNTMNSLAWIASRACRRLDEAEALVTRALDLMPRQAAYLDTLAEVHFARRDRGKAVEFSLQAVVRDPSDSGLLRQYVRFAEAPFPPP
ncbi:MAG: hypothetical protein MUF31_02575 [Akkermansiaceae bacterium]|jgi:tetratricopeptide (TPR) repeat protein|nr:hypothetical protein [Akkermansiaceae bacterium]